MTIVEPHQYSDTPIFRDMLYSREGRLPGTPESPESHGDEGPIAVIPEPDPGLPSGSVALSTPVETVTVKALQSVSSVVAIRAEDIDLANANED